MAGLLQAVVRAFLGEYLSAELKEVRQKKIVDARTCKTEQRT